MGEPSMLSGSQFQAPGACDRPAWGPWGLYPSILSPCLALHLSPFSPTSPEGLAGHKSHVGLSLPSSSESTRSYRRGGRSLEDCPSARQPLPRRNMQVGSCSGPGFEGRWQGIWEAELVKSRHIRSKTSPHDWGTYGPRWP